MLEVAAPQQDLLASAAAEDPVVAAADLAVLDDNAVAERPVPLTMNGRFAANLLGASPAMQEVHRLIERVGPTDASVVFGFVYAQAEDNFPQIEENYIRALGRASEVYGESTAGTSAVDC